MSRLDDAYNECINWKRTASSYQGEYFVAEFAQLNGAFTSSSALESVALKTATVFPILVMQKPHKRSKAKEHTVCCYRNAGSKYCCWSFTEKYINAFVQITGRRRRSTDLPHGGLEIQCSLAINGNTKD